MFFFFFFFFFLCFGSAFSVFKSATTNVQWGWSWVTAESVTVTRTPRSSSGSVKALRCVWVHYPAAVWMLLQKDANQEVQHASEAVRNISWILLKDLDSLVNRTVFPVIHCESLAFLSRPQVFGLVPLLRSGLETATRPRQNSLLVTELSLTETLSESSMKLFFSRLVNWAWWIHLLMLWSLWGSAWSCFGHNWSSFCRATCTLKPQVSPWFDTT